MKGILKENTQEEARNFPRLMKSNASDLVVLFTAEGTGVVVAGTMEWAVGEVSSGWSTSCFTTLPEGKIVELSN